MIIPEDFLTRLRETVDILDTVSPYVSLKKAGRDYVCLCPFHSEKTPSLHVYTENNSFYCFGCGAGGDTITFIRLIENLDYVESVRFLAQKAGLTVPEEGVSDAAQEMRIRILEMNRKAARFFRDLLLSPNGTPALQYLRNRGFTDNIIKKFGLGYAPDDWSTLKTYLMGQGCSEDELLQASLITRGSGANTYDKFRNRAMFPIIDRRGNVIGFSGRMLGNAEGAKYLNSSETPVFYKRSNLFALNFAKNTKEKYIILCEGNLDVIALYQAGFDNAVATLGTAITPEQARLLQNYCEEVVIAYDSDEAGQKATFKAVNLLSDAGLRTRVLEMKDAKDPDEYLLKFGREAFLELIEKSGSAISFELKKLESQVNTDSAEGRAEYLKKAVSLLCDINNRIDRIVYISEVAQKCGVTVQSVESSVDAGIKRKQRGMQREEKQKLIRPVMMRDKINPLEQQFPNEAKAERGIIAYIFHSPDFLNYILSRVTTTDFPTAFNRNLFECLILRLKKQNSIDISALGSEFSVGEVGRIEQIKRDGLLLPFTKKRLDEYIEILTNCREQKNRKSPAEMTEQELLEYTKARSEKLAKNYEDSS